MQIHPLDVFYDNVDALLDSIGISKDVEVISAQLQQL